MKCNVIIIMLIATASITACSQRPKPTPMPDVEMVKINSTQVEENLMLRSELETIRRDSIKLLPYYTLHMGLDAGTTSFTPNATESRALASAIENIPHRVIIKSANRTDKPTLHVKRHSLKRAVNARNWLIMNGLDEHLIYINTDHLTKECQSSGHHHFGNSNNDLTITFHKEQQ